MLSNRNFGIRCYCSPIVLPYSEADNFDMLVLLTYLLHGSVLLEKLNGSAASQEIPRILWNPKVRYLIHKCPPAALYFL